MKKAILIVYYSLIVLVGAFATMSFSWYHHKDGGVMVKTIEDHKVPISDVYKPKADMVYYYTTVEEKLIKAGTFPFLETVVISKVRKPIDTNYYRFCHRNCRLAP